MMKRAFTLIEVNLAMMIMAGGILSIVGLYAFGFRESRQSREDVTASGLADAVMSPLVMAISATNLKWSVFKDIESFPNDKGWGAYLNQTTGLVESDPGGKASTAFSGLLGAIQKAAVGSLELNQEFPSVQGYSCGLVIMHEQDSAVISIGFRAVDKNKYQSLMAMPLFYTEVRFQGLSDE